MHLKAPPLLILPALSPRECAHICQPYAYWVAAAKEHHRWRMAGLRGPNPASTEAQALVRKQLGDLRLRRRVCLEQARGIRDLVLRDLVWSTEDFADGHRACGHVVTGTWPGPAVHA